MMMTIKLHARLHLDTAGVIHVAISGTIRPSPTDDKALAWRHLLAIAAARLGGQSR